MALDQVRGLACALPHRKLRPGRYRLLATATDAAGNSGAPRAVRFLRERLFRPSSRH